MTSITVTGKQSSIEYSNSSNTEGARKKLKNTFGNAILCKDGECVGDEDPSGDDYRYHLLDSALKGANAALVIKFQNDCNTFTYCVPDNVEITLDYCRNVVLLRWDKFWRNEFILSNNDIFVDNEILSKIAAGARSTKGEVVLDVISVCKDFSLVTDHRECLRSHSIDLLSYDAAFKCAAINETEWRLQIDHCLLDLHHKFKLYGPLSNFGQASVREYISPVLSLSALIAGDIRMKAGKQIHGLHSCGLVDYLLV